MLQLKEQDNKHYVKAELQVLHSGQPPKLGDLCVNAIEYFIWTQDHINQDVINNLTEYKNTQRVELYFTIKTIPVIGNFVFDFFKEPYINQITTKQEKEYDVIIASTRKDLIIFEAEDCKGQTIELSIPQPSKGFIHALINNMNMDKIIKDVLIEYIPEVEEEGRMEASYYVPKVNNIDNTVTIKKLKDTYTRDEVKDLLINLANTIHAEVAISPLNHFDKICTDYINQNL